MNKHYIFSRTTSLAHYKAHAFVIRCFDDRFSPVVRAFLRARGVKRFDLESVAGGAKILASPKHKSERAFMLRECATSVRLHATARVIFFTHHDCGAYGGFARFHGSEEKELAFHKKEHKKAVRAIRTRFPVLVIETYFIDQRGVVQISL